MKKIRSLYLFIIIVFCLCTTFLYGQTRGDDIFTFNVECPVIKVDNITGKGLPPNRTTIGVSEELMLSVDPIFGKTTFQVTKKVKGRDHKITAINNNMASLKASFLDDEITITAYVEKNSCGNTINTVIKIIPPTGIFFENICELHKKGSNSVGFSAKMYLKPDYVSFENIKVIERDIPCTATGALSVLNTFGHNPNPFFLPSSDEIVTGKGTRIQGIDCIKWHIDNYPEPILDTGEIIYNIPWAYHDEGTLLTGGHPFVTVSLIGTFTRKLFEGKFNTLLTHKKEDAKVELYKSADSNQCTNCVFK